LHIFIFFFRLIFFSISSIKNEFIGKKASWFFYLLYLGFLWSHDPGHGIRRLTWVDPLCCCLNIFFQKKMS
jgi:hypothetical protein